MLSKTIVLSVAIALASASSALSADRNGKTHRGAPAIQRQMPVAGLAAHAQVRVAKLSSDFERIWFRQAEGPEWN
jgi:hypothetical protein